MSIRTLVSRSAANSVEHGGGICRDLRKFEIECRSFQHPVCPLN